jgi:hypothetical protein
MEDVHPDLLAFGVNETLLDVTALAPRFAAAFPGSDLLAEWFGPLLRYSPRAQARPLPGAPVFTNVPGGREGTPAGAGVPQRDLMPTRL